MAVKSDSVRIAISLINIVASGAHFGTTFDIAMQKAFLLRHIMLFWK